MSKELLDVNLKAMEKWYPVFADLIREKTDIQDETEVLVETSIDGEKIFRIKKDGRSLYLGGKRCAKEPVDMWVERIGKIHKHAPVFLFGIGSGAYLKALVDHTDKEVNIVIYEPSVNIFLKLLEEVDLSEEIKNRPLAFIVEEINAVEFKPVMDRVLTTQTMMHLKEEIHPNYKEFYGDKIIEKMKLLHDMVENVLVGYNTWQRFQKNYPENLFSNMKYVLEGYHTRQLAEAVPSRKVAILVAAGPSLNKNIQDLKAAKNRAFILAVDTAIKPLLKAGIVPDAFITIDPMKPLSLIDIEGAENIPIIAPATAQYTLLDHQKGKKIFFFDSYALPAQAYLAAGKLLPEVSSGGSVACSGFSLLYKMCFDTIILVGQDLAFTDNKSHADGTFKDTMPEEDTKNMVRVKGNYQDEVPTLMNLRMYLNWFNEYIEGAKKHQSNLRVVNATAGGAYIEGTELMPLAEIIKEVCTEEVDYGKSIEQMQPDLDDKARERARKFLGTVPGELADIAKNADLMVKEYKKLDRMSQNKNIDERGSQKALKKITRLTKQCHSKSIYQLVDIVMASAEFFVLSEYYFEAEDAVRDLQETVRKGQIYSSVLKECAELLKELAEELLPLDNAEVTS